MRADRCGVTLRARRDRSGRARAEDGFTLVEMVVTIALAAIVMLALAGALAGSLRSLAVQKARTQGNEVATLSIESLQNLPYDALGVCAPAPGAPDGLDDPAPPAGGCPPGSSESNPGWGEHPCRTTAPTPSSAGFIRSSYTCVRNNITYDVRRYVAWGDLAQTAKRLAVFVKWTDTVGPHEVSQQSSLRAPGAQDIAGLSSPKITERSVAGSVANNPSSVPLTAAGNPAVPVALTAKTSGLAAGDSDDTEDKVYVSFTILDDANFPEVVSVFLSSTNGTNWTGEIPTSYRFGNGTQYLVFSVIRAEDGKGNAVISPKVTFGVVVGTPPTFASWSATPSGGGANVKITAAGALVDERLALAATTQNSSASDTVRVVFETRAGAKAAQLRSTGCAPDGTTCNWIGEIPREAGYSFTAGLKKFYFTVAQPFTVPGSGSTAAEEREVTFTLAPTP